LYEQRQKDEEQESKREVETIKQQGWNDLPDHIELRILFIRWQLFDRTKSTILSVFGRYWKSNLEPK